MTDESIRAVSDDGKRWRVEGPGWTMQPVGEITAGEARRVCELAAALASPPSPDFVRGLLAAAELAKEEFGETPIAAPLTNAAYDEAARTIHKAIMTAVAAYHPPEPYAWLAESTFMPPLEIFDSEESARKWVAAQKDGGDWKPFPIYRESPAKARGP